MKNSYPLNLFPAHLSNIKISSLTGEKFLRASSQKILKLLWEKWDDDFLPASIFNRDFFNFLSENHHSIPSFYKAILKDRDPFFLRATRMEIQDSFNRLLNTVSENPPQTDNQKLKVELAIYNMLSMYVMFSPSPFETLSIPHLVDDKWQNIEFNIEPIELTPTSGWWVNFFLDRDRLFSYGFRAKNNKKVPLILTHCGTGWMTSQGSLIQVIADLWPNKTPGEIFFEWQGRKTINSFLDSNNKKAIVNGHSLGGSLAFLTAMARPEKVEKAICLVPPGMAYDYDKEHPLFGAWESTPLNEKSKVIIQKQTYDPVSKFGIFKNDFKLAKVHINDKSIKKNTPLRLFTSHARNFSAFNDSEITLSKMSNENSSIFRAANNYYLYNKARPLIFYGLLMPYFFIIKPIKDLLKDHAFIITLTLLMSALCLLFPSLALSITSLIFLKNTLVNAILASYILSYSTDILVNTFYDVCLNKFSNFRSYLKTINKKSNLNIIGVLLLDIINILSFGLLKMSLSLFNKIFYDLPNFFYKQHQTKAEIHTQQYHEQTNDLNNHPPPDFKDKLQVISLVILFYIIVFPIKIIFYDLPKLINYFFSNYKSQQEQSVADVNNFKDEVINNIEDDDASPILTNIIIKPAEDKSSSNKNNSKFFSIKDKDTTNLPTLNTHSVTNKTVS